MKTKLILITTVLALGYQFSLATSQTILVTIHNIRPSTKGVIRVAVFGDEQGFKNEQTLFALNYNKSEIANGKLQVEIPIKTGNYGLSVLDDENNNGKMEYNLLGMPKEGFGFSNFTLRKPKKPLFRDFAFSVKEREVKDILVKMRYM